MNSKLLSIIAVFIGILLPMKVSAQTTIYAPEFSFEGDNIVMTCETQGANIYYVMAGFANEDEAYSLMDNLDVSEANSMRTLYTQPFPVTSDVVIKAVAKMPQQQGESEVTTIIYSYTAWSNLLSAIEYGSDVQERAKDSPLVSDDLKEHLKWALEEGEMIYQHRGQMPDSHEAEHFAEEIEEIAHEIDEILNQQPADPEPYAVLSQNNTVLTFYYDTNRGAFQGSMDVTSTAWLDFKEQITTAVFDASFADCTTLTSTSSWFADCKKLTIIEGIENLNTQNVTDMGGMFLGCDALTSLDVSHFNTENVTNMSYMFSVCSLLTTIDVSHFNTSKVTNMAAMFGHCSSLTSLDLSNFNTENVTNMLHMFNDCHTLTTLDLSSFNTANVTSMIGMFFGCAGLKTIYVSDSWSTSNVSEGIEVFYECNNLVGGRGTKFSHEHIDYTYAHIDGGTANPGYLTDVFEVRKIELEKQVEMLKAELEYISRDIEGDDSEDFTVNNTRILKEAIVQKATELMNLGGADIATEMQGIIDAVNNSDNSDTSKDYLRKFVDEVAMRIAELMARLETATTVEELNQLEPEIAKTKAMIEDVHKEVETWKQENQDDENAFNASNVSRYYETMWNRANQLNHQLLQNGDLFVAKGLIFKVIDNENKTCQLGRGEGNHWPDDLRAAHNPKKAEGYEYIVGEYPPGTSGNYLDKEKLTLPDQVLGYTLTVIGEAAFNQQLMNMFELNESLEEISSEAFATYGLSEIFIPAKVRKIGKLAFSRLRANMQRFEVDEQNPYLKHTADYKGVVETATNTLVAACEDIEIPEDIQNLGDGIFYYCSFDNKTLPQNLQTIGANTFQYCSKLTKIELPKTLKSLGNYAFYESGLQEISLPESITNIGDKVFLDCQDLKTIRAYWQQPFAITEDVFSLQHYESGRYVMDNDLYEKSTLYVPYGTKTKYQATEGWSKFQNIVEMEKIEGEAEPYAVLSDNNTVLTFYYDDQKEARNGMGVGPFEYNYDEETQRSIISSGWDEQRESITSVAFDPSFENCTSIESTAYWFSQLNNLTTIRGIEHLNTQNVTDMHWMFEGCSSLTNLNVSTFNTENVRNMGALFGGCSGLTSLDVSNFNTSRVTDMNQMFSNCSGLTSLDLSSFNTANVQQMFGMFNACRNLTSLDLGNFDTRNVTRMDWMFDGCRNLTELNVSSFNTEKVEWIYLMFGGCSSLTHLDLSNFNTSNATEMREMFEDCSSLTSLDLSNFYTPNATTIGWFFRGCTNLVSVDIRNFTTDNIVVEDIFDGCSSLASIQAGNANIPAEEYAEIGNPNLLVYVNEPSLAPEGVQNVVINGQAREIILTDVTEGNNNWFCPEPFTAERISYTRNFRQQTEVGISRGWESIALPFTVQDITHESKGRIIPFGAQGTGKYFWLRGYSPDGLHRATVLEANTPYVISMPNNPAVYPYEYNLNGRVTFSAENTTVPATPETWEMTIARDNIRMAPVFQLIPRNEMAYAINVGQPLDRYAEGSVFTRELREVHPFEAVTYHEPVNGARPQNIRIAPQSDDDITGIRTIELDEAEGTWYSIDGRQLQGQPQRKGVYLQKGKKIVVK